MKTFVIPSIKRAVAPTANENLSAGYPIGQHWLDTATGKEYYQSSDGVWDTFATTHKTLPDKNSEADFQHVDTTVTKPALDAADMVAVKDSVTGKMVLTPKSNLQTAVVQSIGTSETDVMSQKSVTTELALKEVKTNKQNSLSVDGTGAKFPTVDAVNAGLANSGIRALFIARGATYNAATGFYSLNGLTDITEAQMMNIYLNTASQIDNVIMSEMFAGSTFRTAYKAQSQKGVFDSVSARRAFASNTNLEVFSQAGMYFNAVTNMFSECSNLRIIDFINFTNVTVVTSANMLRGCSSLVFADIRYITNNLSFKDSPLLNYESIRRMVLFKSGTTAITITVHADVFEKLTDPTNYPLWYAEAQNGLAKNITFAT